MNPSCICIVLLSLYVVQESISSQATAAKPGQKSADNNILNTLTEMAHGQISELSKIAPLKPYVDDLQSAVDGVSSKMAKISKELEKVYADGSLSPEAKTIVKDLTDTLSSLLPFVRP